MQPVGRDRSTRDRYHDDFFAGPVCLGCALIGRLNGVPFWADGSLLGIGRFDDCANHISQLRYLAILRGVELGLKGGG